MKYTLKKLFIVFFITSSFAICRANILTVDDDGPADFNTIQAAINASNNGDTIMVSPGIYIGIGNRDIDFLGKSITVRSIDPNNDEIVASTIINCLGTKTDPHRGFFFHNNEDGNSILNGITIINGYSLDNGAAILCDNCMPEISHCILHNNFAEGWGGAIATSGYNKTPLISDCLIYSNQAYSGGGISCSGSKASIVNCHINNNRANNYGGGGIICSSGSHSVIKNCIVTFNFAAFAGGGVDCSASGRVTINNSTISYNSTGPGNEWSARGGGGIFMSQCSINLSDSIIWNNSTQSNIGPQIAIYSTGSHFLYASYCDIQGGMGFIHGSAFEWDVGNIDVDPLFADPSIGDFHLKSQAGRWDPNTQGWVLDNVTSPCIDAGNPGCPLGSEPKDSNNIRINMGAFGGTPTASKTPSGWSLLADFTNDGIVDCNDLSFQTNDWMQNGDCLNGDLDRNKTINFSDIALLASDWLKVTSWHQP